MYSHPPHLNVSNDISHITSAPLYKNIYMNTRKSCDIILRKKIILSTNLQKLYHTCRNSSMLFYKLVLGSPLRKTERVWDTSQQVIFRKSGHTSYACSSKNNTEKSGKE